LEIARFNALAHENAVLTRELGKVQERISRVMVQKTAELDRVQAELLRLRAESIAKDSRLAFWAQDYAELQASIPQLDERQRLQKRIEQLLLRQEEQDQLLADCRRKLQVAERSLLERARTERMDTSTVMGTEGPQAPVRFDHKVVLCVGGRTGNVANYRDVVERVGGRFAHHDGGVEDNAVVLDANLAAADLVICQTGCISHNAYWRVKDFCKRTGKQCVYVENASASSLERKLQTLSTPVVQDEFPEESS
ncbi:MAG: hypothetical protein RJB68_1111, partial [Pseudomonadota bacterium]